MKKVFFIGLIAGAVSWAVVGIVSDMYEPFDSEIGFYLGQFILSVVAFYVGCKKRFRELVIYIIGIYLGMNFYSYILGGSEQRAWVLLGLLSTIILIVYPLFFGIVGYVCSFIKKRIVKARSS